VYVNIPVEADVQRMLMWGSVGLVGLLLLTFCNQFLSELRGYGQLMKRAEDKDRAKDSFFFSFTGAIVYGHGAPAHISGRMRLLVGLLSDTLFLVISVQLLQVLACDYGSSEPTLRVDDTMVRELVQYLIYHYIIISLLCYVSVCMASYEIYL
jgi:hypothetical protein